MQIDQYLKQIRRLDDSSHKGQNGKVMVIGGSELFHAASRWALDTVAAMVDMVFYSSVPENNDLIRQAKGEFWSGVVVPRGEIESYIAEADVVLIGPGMTRVENSEQRIADSGKDFQQPTAEEWNSDTYKITNYVLQKYANKKWVVDAGALQMVEPKLFNERMILTPHQGEFERLCQHATVSSQSPQDVSAHLGQATILLKGNIDTVVRGNQTEEVDGGNPGMTKGGTGDVLAGLVAGLYAFSDNPFAAAVIGSYVNKKAADTLYETVGPFFTATQLAAQVPKELKILLYP